MIQSAMADGEFSSRNSLTRAWLYETLQSTGALIQNPRTTCTTSSNNKTTRQNKKNKNRTKTRTKQVRPHYLAEHGDEFKLAIGSVYLPLTLGPSTKMAEKMNKINIRLERSVWDAKCVQCVVSRGRGHGVCYKYCMSSAICY